MDFINIKTLVLINQLDYLNKQLSSLTYGSIEIRKEDDKSYIYVHYRDNGILHNKYVGLYTKQLANLILINNIKAKDIKRQIRKTLKELNQLGYVQPNLSSEVKQNIDFATKHLPELINAQAILEGVITTYVDTKAIIEGGKVNDMSSKDIAKIINLKHAWEFILNSNVISSKPNLALLCEINKQVIHGFYYAAGMLRSVPVKISGTTWIPPLPIESLVKEQIETILSKKQSHIDKAIDLLLYTTKSQLFIDGNKRTSVIFANHYLISHGLGLLVINEKKIKQYQKLLVDYYEAKDTKAIKYFLKECIWGFDTQDDFNEETITSIKEGKRMVKDSEAKRYTSLKEFKKALDD